ncbi:MAG TPA: N-acetylmuramoyl-L-alanine amidase, partial [Allosphingosinicella sp.]|nr:N-acetylmuramoyl-L-alanine amidase [Allosphingosinicella sp.]
MAANRAMSLVAMLISALIGLVPAGGGSGETVASGEGGIEIELVPAGASRPADVPPVLGPAGRPLVVIDPGHG